ncbi:hypothetical protein [Thalassobellus citreus]|uniref:hypothetical protein n=1 Tax=Thalassobellus citreus TaxID=3367752 RepID=UPI0037B0D33D
MKKIVLLSIFILISQISIGQECLNVKFKLRGYFYVGTSQIDSTALGGFYEDQNSPKKLNTKSPELFIKKGLQLIAKTDSRTEFEKGIEGFKVFIVNKTDSIVEIPAQDSRLYLKRQVFYENKWQDIEYLPSSWCGNSYHSVFIKSNEYWDLKAPCLKGKIKSKFRFQLYINDNLTIYSNEFEGSFNKKQLKNEQGHKPIGIMDPYNN